MPTMNQPSRSTIFSLFLAVLVVFGATSLIGSAAAQDADQIRPVLEKLPPPSRSVIERLTELRELPAGQWKMHAGDLAHGEAVNLDESGWQSITPRSNAPNDAVWFRQT